MDKAWWGESSCGSCTWPRLVLGRLAEAGALALGRGGCLGAWPKRVLRRFAEAGAQAVAVDSFQTRNGGQLPDP